MVLREGEMGKGGTEDAGGRTLRGLRFILNWERTELVQCWRGRWGGVGTRPNVFVTFTPTEAEEAGVVSHKGDSCAIL